MTVQDPVEDVVAFEGGDQRIEMGVNPKIGGFYPQNGWFIRKKPYEQMDDLGGNTPIFGNTLYV